MFKIFFTNESLDEYAATAIVFNDSDEYAATAIVFNDSLELDAKKLLLDQYHYQLVSRIIKDKKSFNLENGYSKVITAVSKNDKLCFFILISLGSENSISETKIEEIGKKIYYFANSCKANSVAVHLPDEMGYFSQQRIAAMLAGGALLASYRFDKYLTVKCDEEKSHVERLSIIVKDPEVASKLYSEQESLASGIFFARDCINEPPNILYPESYAQKIFNELSPLGVNLEILGEKEMDRAGMQALLAVGQGSSNESKLVVMKYQASVHNSNPVCLIGKGVTFDSGGISLKPSSGMSDMKYDMSGSAAVAGVIKTLALRKAKVNVVGIVGLVENMPGLNPQRPGDIIKTMSGQTVEVLNTDAEGRLVLCDCITYLQKNFKPACVIDIATLTGAISVALGNTYAGCYANDDDLATKLVSSSAKTNEKLWRMPLHQDYDDMLKSSIADIANIGSERGTAGSSTAAQFISRFIKSDVKWAHLDIAGVAWDKKSSPGGGGGVGFGVKLLNQFIKDNYENN